MRTAAAGILLVSFTMGCPLKKDRVESSDAAPMLTTSAVLTAPATTDTPMPLASTATPVAPLGANGKPLPTVRLPDGGLGVQMPDGSVAPMPSAGIPGFTMPSGMPSTFAVPSTITIPSTFTIPSTITIPTVPPPAPSK